MALKGTIAKAVASAFKALSDVKEDVTYWSHQGSSSYDPQTGTYTRAEVDYEFAGVFQGYDAAEVDGELIKSTDQKFLFQQASLPVKPSLLDRVSRADGTQWQIQNIRQDPASVTWELQLRGRRG